MVFYSVQTTTFRKQNNFKESRNYCCSQKALLLFIYRPFFLFIFKTTPIWCRIMAVHIPLHHIGIRFLTRVFAKKTREGDHLHMFIRFFNIRLLELKKVTKQAAEN
eukprot:TRINITY_DN1608_c0_g1_i11.p1 TRINITY_DN1608_c0_g1~~TRINITY_DN1608_c0_g1_i11.p1  ORF type:complete len:106 (-),score=8.80 TRINITY_DN1608_c0_g1_i11:211-528(-)